MAKKWEKKKPKLDENAKEKKKEKRMRRREERYNHYCLYNNKTNWKRSQFLSYRVLQAILQTNHV